MVFVVYFSYAVSIPFLDLSHVLFPLSAVDFRSLIPLLLHSIIHSRLSMYIH
jgi:hypothetical protein